MIPLLIGGAALGAVYAGVQAFAPRSQLYGRTFIGTPGRGRKIALTFDDGPDERHTPELLNILTKHGVKASFFLLGAHVKGHPELAREIFAGGHTVGNHTYAHPNLLFCSAARVRREIAECEAALNDAGALNEHRLFRPPWGARLPQTLRTIRSAGMAPVLWSITCYDWWPTTPERITWHVMRQLRGGDVLLMHDGSFADANADRAATLKAVDSLVPRLRDQGFEFVTLGDWIQAPGVSGGTQSPPDTP